MIFYGASGHAKVAIEAWRLSGGKVVAMIDDNSAIKELMGQPVSSSKEILDSVNLPLILSIGSNSIRKKLASQIDHLFGNILHPSSIVSEYARIDVGTVVFAGAIINGGTSIGKHCIVNTGAKIDHDCSISDFVHIAPGVTICGGVNVEEGTLVGAGATVIPNITIGKWAIIGAGCVVIDNIPDYSVVMGVPGKVVRVINF